MVTAIVQARMGSTRLAGKTLMPIMDKPLLWHVLERLKRSISIDKIIIATTGRNNDKVILDFAKRYDVDVFRGDENDVLDRFYKAAKESKADVIVRVTPDCPLSSPDVIDKVVKEYLKGGYDYVTNTLVYTYPEGCDVEVFSFEALKKAWSKCKDPKAREHVTPYIRDPKRFRIKNVESDTPVDPNEYKWSVDTKDDLDFVNEVYKRLYKEGEVFSVEDVLGLLKKDPGIKKINSMKIVNEGYYKSFLNVADVKAKKIKIRESLALKVKAEEIIPGCSQTASKGPSQFVQGVSPVFLERGEGSHVWDVDGNEYIDYAMALGPIILGHNYPRVTSFVEKILDKGTTFSLPHRLEVELAEVLCDIVPGAEMVRYGKNGSDVTSGAVRVARAFTGREKIACSGYHGWQDWYIATTTKNRGIPASVKDLTLTFSYNKIETLERLFTENKEQIACVIMEPAGVVPPDAGFLQEVKSITHKNGALLIFDEVVTGFRFALGGASEYFSVTPDLACYGKAMANGFPIAAVTGRKDVMKMFDEIFYSFTFGGEIVSIAAALATIKELRESNCLSHIWEEGRKVRDGYNVLAKEYGLEKYTSCIGFPPRTVITFKDESGEDDLIMKSLFQQECLRRGLLFTGGHNICFSHSDKDVEYTLSVYKTVLNILKDAIGKGDVEKRIEGEPVTPVFRKA